MTTDNSPEDSDVVENIINIPLSDFIVSAHNRKIKISIKKITIREYTHVWALGKLTHGGRKGYLTPVNNMKKALLNVPLGEVTGLQLRFKNKEYRIYLQNGNYISSND